MPEKLTSPPATKLLGLELLRFVAAFAVLIWHYQHFAFVADKAVDLASTRLPANVIGCGEVHPCRFADSTL